MPAKFESGICLSGALQVRILKKRSTCFKNINHLEWKLRNHLLLCNIIFILHLASTVLRSYASRRKGRSIQATKLTTENRYYTLIKKHYLSFWLFFWARRDCATFVHSERSSRHSNTKPLVQKPHFQPLRYRSPFRMIPIATFWNLLGN